MTVPCVMLSGLAFHVLDSTRNEEEEGQLLMPETLQNAKGRPEHLIVPLTGGL